MASSIKEFTREDFQEYSTFSLVLELSKNDDYYLEFIIEDGFHPSGQVLYDDVIDNGGGGPLDILSLILRLLIFGIIIIPALLVSVFLIRLLTRKRRNQKQQKSRREYTRASKIGITVDEIMSREDY
ncbi:MAG: hypothetical protein ACTSRT_19570 [Promethearchaeota archaeon]